MTDHAAGRGPGPSVLAVAESDAYLKWAAWLIDDAGWPAQLTVLASDTAPSDRQRAEALSGTGFETDVTDESVWSLRRRLRRQPPDVLLLACTGPTIAIVTSLLPRRRPRPLVVSGLPGVGLPVRERAIRARRGVDVFVAHSQRERAEYATAFAADTDGDGEEPTAVALASLPFVRPAGGPRRRPIAGGRVVFAPQPSVPPRRQQRCALLIRLAELGPPPPVVKLRSLGTESVTHQEPHRYDELWGELVDTGIVVDDAVEFAEGNLGDWLADASCLVTVSSTAALEAIGVGCPVVIIDDFGVNDELLNGVFAGSGLTGSLARSTVASARTPGPDWLAENYFHGREEDDWVDVVSRRLTMSRRRRGVGARTLLSRTVVGKARRLLVLAGRR